MQTDRDRLIDLVDKAKEEYANDITDHTETDYIVETLFNEGAILPPCKVGDKIYCVTNLTHSIAETVVIGMWIADGTFSILTIHGVIVDDSLGKTVFLTKEEAEQALAERSNQ